MSSPEAEGFVSLGTPIDLELSLAPIAHGRGDPTIRFAPDGIWRATRTAAGAATLHLRVSDGGVAVEAWGPGAASAVVGALSLAPPGAAWARASR